MQATPSYNPSHPLNTMLRDIAAVVRQSCDAAAYKRIMGDIRNLESIGTLATQGEWAGMPGNPAPWDKLTHGSEEDQRAEVGAA